MIHPYVQYKVGRIVLFLGLDTATYGNGNYISHHHIRSAEKILAHKGFKPGSNNNNIALVKLKKWFPPKAKAWPFEQRIYSFEQWEYSFYSKLIMPICLPGSSTLVDKDRQGFAFHGNS